MKRLNHRPYRRTHASMRNLRLRAIETSAVCPACGRRDAGLSHLREGYLFCWSCSFQWPIPVLE
jgi:hypothetical protein